MDRQIAQTGRADSVGNEADFVTSLDVFPLYVGIRPVKWTWQKIKAALVGNTQKQIDRFEAEYGLTDEDLGLLGPDHIEWHISGDRLMNNYLWGNTRALTEKPWWQGYEEWD